MDKLSLTDPIELFPGTSGSISRVVLYHSDLVPIFTLLQSGNSRACSSDILQCAWLFIVSSEMSVGCLSLDDADRASEPWAGLKNFWR